MLMTNSPARLTVNTATCPHQWLVLPRPTLRLARSRRRLPVTATSSVQPAEGDPPRARNRRRAPGSNQAPQRRTPRTPPDNKPASNNPSKGLRKVEYKGPMSNVARVVLSRQSPAIARLLREVVADIKVGHHKNRTEQAALTDSLHRILDAVPMLALESVPGVVWVTGKLATVPALTTLSRQVQEAAVVHMIDLLPEYKLPDDFVQAPKGTAAAAMALGPVDPARLLWGMAAAGVTYPTDTVLALAAVAEANAQLMAAQGLANCTWALSKLVPTYNVASSCLDVLAVHTLEQLDEMQPQHLSNVLLAWAHLEHIPESVDMERYGQAVMQAAPIMQVQHFTNILWALGKRNCLPASIDLEEFVGLAVKRLPDFNPQNLANLLWALAVFKAQPSAFDPEVHAQWVMRRLGSTIQQNLASNLWSWAALYGRIPRAVDVPAYCKALNTTARGEVTAKGITNVWWAFAALNYQPPEFDAALYNHLFLNLMEQAKPMGIANMLYSWTALDAVPNQETLDMVLETMMMQATTRQSPGDDAHSVVAAMYSMANHRTIPQRKTMQDMVDYVAQHAWSLKPEYANNVLLASAVLQAALPETLVIDLLTNVTDHSEQTQQGRWVSNALWACVAMYASDPQRLTPLLPAMQRAAQVAAACKDWTTDLAWVKQVYTAHMTIKLLLPEAQPLLPEPMLSKAHAMTDEEESRYVVNEEDVTIFQRQVSLAASALLDDVAIEQVVSTLLVRVDVLARAPDGSPVVIEADGPSHCYRNAPLEPTGRTLLRNALLRAAGFKLVVVRWQDWQLDATSPSAKLELLRELLVSEGVL